MNLPGLYTILSFTFVIAAVVAMEGTKFQSKSVRWKVVGGSVIVMVLCVAIGVHYT